MAADTSPASATTPVNQLRQTAKWLIAAFAGVGAALAAGVQISNLGSAAGIRLAAAVFAAAAGLTGIMIALYQVGKVLTTHEATTSDLQRSKALEERLNDEPSFDGGFGLPPDVLINRYESAFRQWRMAQVENWARPTDPAMKVALGARESEFEALSDVVQFWRSLVIYEKTKRDYRKAQTWVLIGAVLGFGGLVGFAWAANPAKPTSPTLTNITVPPGPAGAPGPRGPRGYPARSDSP